MVPDYAAVSEHAIWFGQYDNGISGLLVTAQYTFSTALSRAQAPTLAIPRGAAATDDACHALAVLPLPVRWRRKSCSRRLATRAVRYAAVPCSSDLTTGAVEQRTVRLR